MRWLIAYLIAGEAKRYQEKIIEELSEKFKTPNLNKKVMPHITLKAPFEREDIRDIEEKIEEFSSSKKSSKIKINGFGNFKKRVIYLNIIFSEKSKKIKQELIQRLKGLPSIKFDRHDFKNTPHSTISYARSFREFSEMSEFLSGKEKNYSLKFDNITILKKSNDKWIVHKEFKIK